MSGRFRWLALISVICAALFPATVLAEPYPDKPIRLILPYNPGGIIDYIGRILARQLSDALGDNYHSGK